jgi:hypothetical protein
MLIQLSKITSDTSEIEFYLSTSKQFRELSRKEGFAVSESDDGIYPSSNGRLYLHVSKKKAESVRFYVHEFTEITLTKIFQENNMPIYTTPIKVPHELSPYGKNKRLSIWSNR